jgi:rhodanese-related sulfurtransferase
VKRIRWIAVVLFLTVISQAQQLSNVYNTPLGEKGAKVSEISTEEFRGLLNDKSVTVFDVRPPLEFAISHIPGAVNVAQKPGTSKALYVSDVAEIERLLAGKKSVPLVLYCNGPFCGKSRRLADELAAAGFNNLRRYQLGIPVWRALGGVTQIEAEGVRYVMQSDHTAVWLDTRAPELFEKNTLPGAKRLGIEVTRGGKDNPAMERAKNDGTLPANDHNTRIVVFGDDPELVRSVAGAVAKEAFHNVSFYSGSYQTLRQVAR